MFPLSLNQPVLLYKIEESLCTDDLKVGNFIPLSLVSVWNLE